MLVNMDSMMTLLLTALLAHDPPPVAATASPDTPSGVLRFQILDGAGRPTAGRLTFIGADGAGADLFPNADAAPHDLAVRANVIYSLSGVGAVRVPVGDYTVHASRGLEWSVDRQEIAIDEHVEAEWIATLEHEIDTTGWISGDFHLHTLTYSGHGDSNMFERIISLVGEGVEFAVATDHNHRTDYGPTIAELDAGGALTAVTGNEVSVPIGHFNTFPLDPAGRPVSSRIGDANALFAFLRAQTSEHGVTPVIQVNHPRWGSIDYFGLAGLDPVTGHARHETWSPDFDTIEVLNENAQWGYYDADVTDRHVGGSVHHALQDWFNLLNLGHRAAAVGNSDSHTVYTNHAGFPRNFVRSTTDDAGAIDAAEIAGSIRAGQVFTTSGPFVHFTVNDAAMGETVVASGGEVEVRVRIQAASWIDCDRVKIVVNGDVVRTLAVPDHRWTQRLDESVTVPVTYDSWIVALVEGDDSLAPVVHDGARPVTPIAIMNPIRVEADGRDGWTPPMDRFKRHLVGVTGLAARLAEYARARPNERAMMVRASAGNPLAVTKFISNGLVDDDRRVRLAAIRVVEQHWDDLFLPALERLVTAPESDAYLALSALRALRAGHAPDFDDRFVAFLDRFGQAEVGRYGAELMEVLPGRFVTDWMTIGYFPNPEQTAVTTTSYPPETNADTTARHEAKQGPGVGWVRAAADANGFLSLRHLDGRREMFENAIAYAQTWLHASSDRRVRYTLGSDDGCRLFINDELVHEAVVRRGAAPMQHLGEVDLRAGWNRVLFKVENGTGGFGLYFRVLDDEVTWSETRP